MFIYEISTSPDTGPVEYSGGLDPDYYLQLTDDLEDYHFKAQTVDEITAKHTLI